VKITLLEVRDYKRVGSIKIEPGARHLIQICGRNRQGKSSLLDALTVAFGGKGEAAAKPVRDGADRADIIVELDDGAIEIHRSFTAAGKHTLDVRNPDGRLGKPQAVLDQLVGARFLDPLKFSRMSEREQRATLLGVVDLGIDLDAMALERGRLYDDRTEVNREVKRLEGATAVEPEYLPAVVDTDALVAELADLRAREDRAAAARKVRDRARAAVMSAKAAGRAAAERLERAQAEVRAATMANDEAGAAIEEALRAGTTAMDAVAVDLAADPGAAIQAQISAIVEAEARNRAAAVAADALARHEKLLSELAERRTASDALTEGMIQIDATVADALAAAAMPIADLGVGSDCLTYCGVPLSQASGAEQLRVSLAIAAALSKELQDVWIKDGSLLDDDSLALLAEFAEAQDLRIWIERVGDGDDDAITIEDGHVAGVEEEGPP